VINDANFNMFKQQERRSADKKTALLINIHVFSVSYER